MRPANQTQGGGTPGAGPAAGQIPGYFDQNGNPVYTTKMSTVGSASATGSVGGRTTTWASGSMKGQTEAGDEDQMSMDANYRDIDDRDRFSAMDEDMDGDGMSDDTSLVGFGEGAGSTVSGPIYSRRDLAASPAVGRSGLVSHTQSSSGGGGTPASVAMSTTAEQQRRDARMIDGVADDAPGYVDTARMPSRGSGTEATERILRERLDDGEARRPLGSPDEAELGKLYFEEKK